MSDADRPSQTGDDWLKGNISLRVRRGYPLKSGLKTSRDKQSQ